MNRILTISSAFIASVLLLIAMSLGVDDMSVYAQQGDVPTPTPTSTVETDGVIDIQVDPSEGKISKPNYPKLSSDLNYIVEQGKTDKSARESASLRNVGGGASKDQSQVIGVTILIEENHRDAIVSYLDSIDALPRHLGTDFIEAYVPVSLLVEASQREGVLRIDSITPPQPAQGTIISQGVAAHGVTSWHEAGFKGQGVKIGVIDKTFGGFSDLMGTELPATVSAECHTLVYPPTTNLHNCGDSSSDKHGTAVTEVLFDIAPEAEYYIANPDGLTAIVRTTAWMVSEGVDVINMSLVWPFEGPGDGTSRWAGSPLSSVNKAVEGGIIWVNGAGNDAKNSWYGAFGDSDSDDILEFDTDGDECNGVTIDLQFPEVLTVQLRWDDVWVRGATKDLDLYLIPVTEGTTPSLSDAVVTSEDEQTGVWLHIPYEKITLRGGSALTIDNGDYCLAVKHAAGAEPSWVQLLVWEAEGDLEHYVSSHNIGTPGDSKSAGMLAVGAALHSSTDTIQSFSSRGPTTDDRIKPDIVGADGGNSSSYGRAFYGTSAASPHVAGLAALVKQANPTWSPSQVATYLKDRALGRGTVPNNTWGYGFAKLPSAPDPTLSALTMTDVDFGTFSSDTTLYYATVANSISETTVTPTLNDTDASYHILIQGVRDEDDTVSLREGRRSHVTVVVTADDDATVKKYLVIVTRAESVALTYGENGTASLRTFQPDRLRESTTTWSLTGTDEDDFIISSEGTLSFASTPDYESPSDSGQDNVYEVTVTARDDRLRDHLFEVTVTVEGVDEPPVINGTSTIDDYDENDTGDVATYTASDPEGDTDITWSLSGTDQEDFEIAGGVLTFKDAPDHESPDDSGRDNHYEVTVQATDSNSNRGELHVDVIVKDIDEPPVITGPETVDDFPENSAVSRQVGRYTVNNPERTSVSLSLTGTDNAKFTLASNGTLTFNESPDYEEQASYNVTLRAATGSQTVNRAVTISIQNVEEPGTVLLSSVQPQVDTVFTATLTDDDEPTGTTWQWYRASSRSSAGTAITNASSRSFTPTADDVGRYLRVVASYDDGYDDGNSAAAVSTYRTQEAPPVPEPPEFPADGNYSRSIRENLPAGRNVGASVTATDGNSDKLTYSLAASDEFEIVESTGQLRAKVPLDHEAQEQYSVTVTRHRSGRPDRQCICDNHS